MGKQFREAGALAIRNIGVIEQVYKLIDNEITKELYILVEAIIKKNIPSEWEQELSCVVAKALSDDSSWFAPQEWKNSDDESEAQFEVWAESPEDGGDVWCMTQLCGQGEAEMGFRWSGNHKVLMPKPNRPIWKNFASQQNDKHTRLSELGFRYEEKNGSWFMPLIVEVNDLAKAYAEEDMENVLEPTINECLIRIKESVPIFSTILNEAKKLR